MRIFKMKLPFHMYICHVTFYEICKILENIEFKYGFSNIPQTFWKTTKEYVASLCQPKKVLHITWKEINFDVANYAIAGV